MAVQDTAGPGDDPGSSADVVTELWPAVRHDRTIGGCLAQCITPAPRGRRHRRRNPSNRRRSVRRMSADGRPWPHRSTAGRQLTQASDANERSSTTRIRPPHGPTSGPRQPDPAADWWAKLTGADVGREGVAHTKGYERGVAFDRYDVLLALPVRCRLPGEAGVPDLRRRRGARRLPGLDALVHADPDDRLSGAVGPRAAGSPATGGRWVSRSSPHRGPTGGCRGGGYASEQATGFRSPSSVLG